MYAPILLPPTPQPTPGIRAAIAAAERAIIDAERPYHVDGRYVSRADDATRLRHLTAERRVRDAIRVADAAPCEWRTLLTPTRVADVRAVRAACATRGVRAMRAPDVYAGRAA